MVISFPILRCRFYSARDIGGQSKLRPLWRHYFINTDALVFVVDSSDLERIEEARDEMFHVLRDPNMDACQTVLILLNKQVGVDCCAPKKKSRTSCDNNFFSSNGKGWLLNKVSCITSSQSVVNRWQLVRYR